MTAMVILTEKIKSNTNLKGGNFMSFNPIDRQTFSSLSVHTVTNAPPERVVTRTGEKINVQINFKLSADEIAVISLLGRSIQQHLTSNAFLLTFDTRDMEPLLFSNIGLLAETSIDDVLGGLWVKTQELVLAELASQDDLKEFKSEKEWLLLASARTWESIGDIYNFREKNTSERVGEEPPFRLVFTNRQAQVLQVCANQIINMIKNPVG
jgi:hypothetical protein